MNTRGKALGRLAILLVVLAVAALAVAGVFGSRMNKKDSAGFRADLSGFESAAYARAGNGFAAVSGVSCRLYGANGDVLQTVSRSYSDVQIVGAEGCAAVWSEGGTGLTLLIGEQAKDLTFSGGVTGVDINDECTAAVLAGENGYKGSVSVYNGSGDGIYRVYVGSGYPVDAAVSPDSRSVAILSLTAEGSAVSVYRLDSEKAAAEYLEEGCSCFDLQYLSDGRLLLLSADRAVFLKDDGRLLGRWEFGGEYLKDYAAGDGFVCLLLGRYHAGTGGRIVLLDTTGTVTAQQELSGDAEGVSAAGKNLALRFADRTAVYDLGLTELGSLESTSSVQAVMMRPNGGALIISGGKAAIFEP